MYNRYIPQPDGSYRRSQVPEHPHMAPPRPDQSKQEHRSADPEPECPKKIFTPEPPPKKAQPCAHMRNPRAYRREKPQKQEDPAPSQSTSVPQFLKQLLPKDFDTGDLLVIILLLLMSGDCAEDQNTALLTMALYLFM